MTIRKLTLLPKETLAFSNLIPLAIDFTPEGKLVVLGCDAGQEEKKASDLELWVLDNFSKGRYSARSKSTGLRSSFDGTVMGAESFQGSLEVGSDGFIYVSGKGWGPQRELKRFTSDLNDVPSQAGGLEKALLHLKREGYLSGREVHQAIEEKGTFYFAIQSLLPFSRSDNNCIVAVRNGRYAGKGVGYDPYGLGMIQNQWEKNPKIALQGIVLYFKASVAGGSRNIVAISKELSAQSIPDFKPVIPQQEIEPTCIPSNFCLGREGELYVVTQRPGESDFGSIKVYSRGSQQWNCTATAPLQGESPPSFKSMAVRDDGLVAYTDPLSHQIHFYRY